MARRDESNREAKEELHLWVESQLGAVAACAGDELHGGATGASGTGCEHCQLGVELLSKLPQLLGIRSMCLQVVDYERNAVGSQICKHSAAQPL